MTVRQSSLCFTTAIAYGVFSLLANPAVGLSRCPELRRLTVAVVRPQEGEQTLISSITSTNFQRLILVAHPSISNSDLDNAYWRPFDNTLCGLVDRLQSSGYKHTLEVELRADIVNIRGEVTHEKFLPKFKKKGRVRIVEISSGTVQEWP